MNGLTYTGWWLGIKVGCKNPSKIRYGRNLYRSGRSNMRWKNLMNLSSPGSSIKGKRDIQTGAATFLLREKVEDSFPPGSLIQRLCT
jgi:hypothetical protein